MKNEAQKIKLWDKVMLKSGAGGNRVDIFRVVPPAGADPEIGRISAESALGAAILGRSAGELVEFETLGIPKTVRILRIIPEAND